LASLGQSPESIGAPGAGVARNDCDGQERARFVPRRTRTIVDDRQPVKVQNVATKVTRCPWVILNAN
jgi:hypothetical protein